MKEYYDKFQVTDFDHDIVGICYILVEWMKFIYQKSKELNVELCTLNNLKEPDRYYKHPPHFPMMEIRKNVREMLFSVLNSLKEIKNKELVYNNVFTAIIAIAYIYNLPAKKMCEIVINNEDFDREKATKILLEDGMSENWLSAPKPSDTDFSAIMNQYND